MPHKHKRKHGADDDYELAPTQKARPLSVSANNKEAKRGPPVAKKHRKNLPSHDDASRAFRRLMAFARGRKTRAGLDDGDKSGSATAPGDVGETPRILPGEDMRSFAARVDAALPVSGLVKKNKVKDGKDEAGLKVRRTRKERKMHKLYDQWRAEEASIQERRQEELELAAEREMDNDAAGMFASPASMGGTGEIAARSKGRRRQGKAEDEDPWLELKRRRAEVTPRLHDVARAPPELHKKVGPRLRVGDATVDVGNVPRAAGSLRQREELQVARTHVIEAYRRIREHERAKLDAQRERGRDG